MPPLKFLGIPAVSMAFSSRWFPGLLCMQTVESCRDFQGAHSTSSHIEEGDATPVPGRPQMGRPSHDPIGYTVCGNSAAITHRQPEISL